jgi:hypothetical protein
MQDSPAKEALLFAVSRFLTEQVRPQVQDAKTSFGLLIAAHLCMSVAQECTGQEDQDAAELARLRALFPDLPATPRGVATATALVDANRRLAAALRDGALTIQPADGPVFAHLKATLLEKIQINNPRFDQRSEIDG